jgi:hypothetical protein
VAKLDLLTTGAGLTAGVELYHELIYIPKAGVGLRRWVTFRVEITNFLEGNAEKMGTPAFSRAIGRMPPKERARLRDQRKARLA